MNWRDIPLTNVELSVRADRLLREAGYHTLGDVEGLSMDDLRAIHGIGRKTAREIIEHIQHHARKANEADLWIITEQATKAVSETVSASVKLGQRYERERIVAWLREKAVNRICAANQLVKSDVLHEDDKPEHTRLSTAYGELWTAADEIEAME